jgi:hypothetical protein
MTGIKCVIHSETTQQLACRTDGVFNRQTTSYVHTFTRDILSAIFGWNSSQETPQYTLTYCTSTHKRHLAEFSTALLQ